MKTFMSLLPLLLIAAGCSSTTSELRSEFSLTDDHEIRQENVLISVEALDSKRIKSDPRLTARVDLQHVQDGGIARGFEWSLTDAPVFRVRITNNTDHVLRLGGTHPVVIRLVDSTGNTYRPFTKESLAALREQSLSPSSSPTDWYVMEGSHRTVNKILRNVPLLGPNAEVIPGASETYYVAFDVADSNQNLEREEWLSQHATLTLKLFDVTVKTGEDASASKRVGFDFPVRVTTYRDEYEISFWSGKQLVKSTGVPK